MNQNLQPGDLVIYRKSKQSTLPGPRATNVQPARNGDNYSYTVDKFWIVEKVLEDGTVVAATRRGKRNEIRSDDPLLKRANLIERFLYRARFASVLERHESTSARVGNESASCAQ